MRPVHPIIVAIALGLGWACSTTRPETSSDSAQAIATAAREAIEAADLALLGAIRSRDARAAVRLYAPGAISYQPGMEPLTTPAAIEAFYRAWFARGTFDTVDVAIDTVIVAADLLLEFGRYSGTLTATDGTARRDRGRYLTVWRKQPDGSWKRWREMGTTSG
jgi:ketosteroid isomerase-like protein